MKECCSGLEKEMARVNEPVGKRIASIFNTKRKPKYVYAPLSDFLSRSGKRLRPALCLLSCEAVGGGRKAAMDAAVAIELFHNFTLIHDDIEDASEMRRGVPCMHITYGLPLAINAGDGLFMMVWQEALKIGGKKSVEAQRRLLNAFTQVLEGQAIELGWYLENRWDVSEDEYMEMVGGKTGALLAASCEVGGLLGGGTGRQCRALYEFGMGIGVGFQIIDDALNLIGDEKRYMKEIGGDVREGKRTLIMMWALKALPKKRLRALPPYCARGKKAVWMWRMQLRS